MKRCLTCKVEKPLSHFPEYDDFCFKCHRAPKQQKAKKEKSYTQIKKESIQNGSMEVDDFYAPKVEDFI